MPDGPSDVVVVIGDASDGGAKDGDACVTCGSTTTCVDLQNDSNNCGACGRSCGDAGYACTNGGCGNEVIDLATGMWHACAVLRAGEVWCWGQNDDQECGGPGGNVACNRFGTSCRTPKQVGSITNAVGVGASNASTCVVTADGKVLCWGYNGHAELGNDAGGTASYPIQVNLAGKATFVAGGASMMCAVTDQHDLYCWGRNECGSMGLGFTGATDGGDGEDFGPTFVMGGVESVRMSYPNQPGSTCVMQTDGGASCFGTNVYGALAYISGSFCYSGGGNNANPSPHAYQVPQKNVTKVSPGLMTCAVASGSVFCSGALNTEGQLGNGLHDGVGTGQPSLVNLPTKLTFVDVWSSGNFECALASTGEVYCWGAPTAGELGLGYDDAGNPPQELCGQPAINPCWPTASRVGTFNATMLRTGGSVGYALDDGGLWAWGWDDTAQLGVAPGTSGEHQTDASAWFNAIPSRVPLP
jgi:alpha-tubulin suppressor-like RCC1 family protein